MASHSASSKNSKGSSASNHSMHSEAKKDDSQSVEQEHVLTSRMLSLTHHDYHSRQLNLKPNNHFAVLEPKGYPEEAAPLIQILKNHILTKALTLKRTDIPETYIQQFWLSAKHEKLDRYGYYVMGYATHPSTTQILDLGINRRRVAEVFELPIKTQLNLTRYSDEPSDDEILEFLQFIGYAAPISKRTDFRRQNLPPLWNVLFSILNRCLTCKVGSPDQSSHTILAIMYGVYYDLPLDYATLIFKEIRNAVIAKQEDQGEGKLPTEGKMIKVYDMKSHKPTVLQSGYPGARPLPARILAYLNSEDGVRTYIRGHRTPATSPATPPRVGFQVGEIAIYLRIEIGEGVVVRTEDDEGAEVQTEVVGEKREKKLKKKRTPKKRVAEEEAPKSPTEVAKPKKKAKKLTKATTSEPIPSPAVSEPAESEQPLQRRRRKAQVIESSEERPSSPLRVAMDIAEEIQKLHSRTLGEFADFAVTDVTGLSSSDDEVLVQRGIETGPHSPNPAQTIRTEDIPSSSVPPSGETKTTSPSQKGESVALRVHLPQDTSLSHTEVFVTSVTHMSDTQTTSELVVREHDDFVALKQPQDPFNIDLKGVSEPSPKERVDRTSIGASSVEHRGLEGNPPELIIKTGSEGAKDSLAKFGTYVVLEVTSDTFVTKAEFKAFADMVLKKLDELQSSISRESQDNSHIFAEALKANTEALQALSSNCAKRADLQACGNAIIAHSHQIQVLGDLCTEEFPKYATNGVQTGVVEMARLREEIKDITRSVMVPAHTQASTSSPDPSAFATKADLETMGNQFLQNQNLLRSDFNDQGKKVAADLKKTVATFRFKSDVEINALSLAAEDALQKINQHAEDLLCKRKKRKAPATCQAEAS
ncbi:hypothetical protein L6452_32289 [Arctium lappa]|uniref:Uncharacterized protein n=1 Tax=Arctium lappa TaxID=4217 RepID=A0ACB8Z4E5_ARCLA|nr:hypothetical protein L6452_32289 [Arctium lappa]